MGSWNDPLDVREYRKDRRKKLRPLPEDRKCPKCLRVIMEDRKWVINEGMICCRRCYHWHRQDATDPDSFDFRSVFDKVLRYKVDGNELRTMRECLLLSQTAFAKKAGWHQTYQWKLENHEIITVNVQTMKTILQVVKEELEFFNLDA